MIRAEGRISARPAREPVVRTGLVRVGADVTASGDQLVAQLQEGVLLLDRDVQKDACGDAYGAGCVGANAKVDALEAKLAALEASGTKLDASNVLTAAGVDPSPKNVDAFGACVQKRKNAGSAVPRGTLAYCALTVKGGTSIPKAHTTSVWRDEWQTFVNSFQMFVSRWETGSTLAGTAPSDSELSSYLDRYMGFRSSFVDAGGVTSAPTIAEPWSLTTKVVVLAGVVFVLYFVGQILVRRFGGP